MKVYISGAISGQDYTVVKQRFGEAAQQLRSKGYEPVSPLNNGVPSSADWREHMKVDLSLLLGCEAIYLLDGWEDSRGARAEYALAIEAGMRIFKSNELK